MSEFRSLTLAPFYMKNVISSFRHRCPGNAGAYTCPLTLLSLSAQCGTGWTGPLGSLYFISNQTFSPGCPRFPARPGSPVFPSQPGAPLPPARPFSPAKGIAEVFRCSGVAVGVGRAL